MPNTSITNFNDLEELIKSIIPPHFNYEVSWGLFKPIEGEVVRSADHDCPIVTLINTDSRISADVTICYPREAYIKLLETVATLEMLSFQ